MLKPKVIFLDLDNTLFNRNRLVCDYLQQYGVPLVSNPILSSLREHWRQLQKHNIVGSWTSFEKGFHDHLRRTMVPNHQIQITLDRLKRLAPIALVTNGTVKRQRLKLKLLGLQYEFEKIFISESIGFKKPAPEMMEHILCTMSVNAKDCLMVGDSLECDIQFAHKHSMPACWIRNGQSPSNEVIPEIIINTIFDLPLVLKC